MARGTPGDLPRSDVDEYEVHLQQEVVKLVEQDRDDEVIEGEPLREVAVVVVEEEEGEDEDQVLARELGEGTPEELQSGHRQNQSCSTAWGEREGGERERERGRGEGEGENELTM